MNNQIINIIGGSGFIGSSLCRRFYLKKLPFKILDLREPDIYQNEFIYVDIREIELLKKLISANSIIVNLAAEHRDDVRPKTLYDQVNVNGADNICKIARFKNVQKIIFTSSVAVYGFPHEEIDEQGTVNYFNDYGRTKWEAEKIYRIWQEEDPNNRTLVIIRPTVVFGERNRGNVYQLMSHIAAGKFVMVGNGENRKSMAYVENVAAFIEHVIDFDPGIHIFNYVDKPDYTMNQLVSTINSILKIKKSYVVKIPYFMAFVIGKVFDGIAFLLNKSFSVSSIRIKKFCSNSVYASSVNQTKFTPPFSLSEGLKKTIEFEFQKKIIN